MTGDNPADSLRGSPDAAQERRFAKTDLWRVGQHLRGQRIAAGMSLRRLSERSGVSVTAIRAIESGRANPSLATVVPVVEALGIMLDRVIKVPSSARSDLSVTRATDGDVYITNGLIEPALAAQIVTLPVKSIRHARDSAARNPSFCVVLQGTVFAAIDADGGPALPVPANGRVRLEAGDNYHAQPGVIQSLSSGGGRDARVLVVIDTRRNGEPTTS
jgi:transcriptional regulator with XRE-family HTH domain